MKTKLLAAALFLILPVTVRAQAIPALHVERCALLSPTLCAAVHDKPVMLLTALHTAAIVDDGISTAANIGDGATEGDPVARLFIGKHPTWKRMAPAGAGEIIAETWVAERMKTSNHKWVRRIWWVPQVADITVNVYGMSYNLRYGGHSVIVQHNDRQHIIQRLK